MIIDLMYDIACHRLITKPRALCICTLAGWLALCTVGLPSQQLFCQLLGRQRRVAIEKSCLNTIGTRMCSLCICTLDMCTCLHYQGAFVAYVVMLPESHWNKKPSGMLSVHLHHTAVV